MTPRTLAALRKSIKKWEGIVCGEIKDKGRDNCALCQMFWKGTLCDGCPVKEKTGRRGCRRSPYDKWLTQTTDTDGGRWAATAEQVRTALTELRFLESLLPKGAKR